MKRWGILRRRVLACFPLPILRSFPASCSGFNWAPQAKKIIVITPTHAVGYNRNENETKKK